MTISVVDVENLQTYHRSLNVRTKIRKDHDYLETVLAAGYNLDSPEMLPSGSSDPFISRSELDT